ncbi:hypothetical protein Tco_1064793, partial [Tanacetum coccineum]
MIVGLEGLVLFSEMFLMDKGLRLHPIEDGELARSQFGLTICMYGWCNSQECSNDRYVWTLDSAGVFRWFNSDKEIAGNQFQACSLPT